MGRQVPPEEAVPKEEVAQRAVCDGCSCRCEAPQLILPELSAMSHHSLEAGSSMVVVIIVLIMIIISL